MGEILEKPVEQTEKPKRIVMGSEDGFKIVITDIEYPPSTIAQILEELKETYPEHDFKTVDEMDKDTDAYNAIQKLNNETFSLNKIAIVAYGLPRKPKIDDMITSNYEEAKQFMNRAERRKYEKLIRRREKRIISKDAVIALKHKEGDKTDTKRE